MRQQLPRAGSVWGWKNQLPSQTSLKPYHSYDNFLQDSTLIYSNDNAQTLQSSLPATICHPSTNKMVLLLLVLLRKKKPKQKTHTGVTLSDHELADLNFQYK